MIGAARSVNVIAGPEASAGMPKPLDRIAVYDALETFLGSRRVWLGHTLTCPSRIAEAGSRSPRSRSASTNANRQLSTSGGVRVTSNESSSRNEIGARNKGQLP